MLVIESKDGRFQAKVSPTEGGARFSLMRLAGATDIGGVGRAWRVLETGELHEVPFHVALDHIERIVWLMADTRSRLPLNGKPLV